MPRPHHFFILLSLGLWLAIHTACSNNATPPSPVSENCESVATQCRLPRGALGVCLYDSESKLQCMPQH